MPWFLYDPEQSTNCCSNNDFRISLCVHCYCNWQSTTKQIFDLFEDNTYLLRDGSKSVVKRKKYYLKICLILYSSENTYHLRGGKKICWFAEHTHTQAHPLVQTFLVRSSRSSIGSNFPHQPLDTIQTSQLNVCGHSCFHRSRLAVHSSPVKTTQRAHFIVSRLWTPTQIHTFQKCLESHPNIIEQVASDPQ